MMSSSRSSSRRRTEARDNRNSRPRDNSAATRYDVLERAGEGTLFVVYRVRDRKSHAICALKALKGVYSRHPQFAPAVMQSAQSVATLRHLHLANVVEAGREDGTVFLVEQWMPGGSLETRLRRSPLTRPESTLMATQLCDGLAAIHNAGFIHGDLRPRQVLFDAAGNPCLDDIGFASAFESSNMSLADVQFDALHYLAPERFDGKNASPSADLYALGVVLYRALTGRVPFDGPSAISIAMRHRNDYPLSPTQFNADCSPTLAQAVLKLLSKDPQDRYQSADQLLADITPGYRSTPARLLAPIIHPEPEAIEDETLAEDNADLEQEQEAFADFNAGSTPESGEDDAATSDLDASNSHASNSHDADLDNADLDVQHLDIPAPVIVPLSTPPLRTQPTVSPSRLRPVATPVADTAISSGSGFDDDLDDAVKVRQSRMSKRKQGKREIVGALLAFFWLLVAGGLLFGVCFGAYRFWIQEAPPEIRVPRYVGLQQDDAERVLINSGLQMRVGKEVYTPKKPAGIILIGDPPPGKLVRKGRLILVTVSRGEEPVRMVDFSELTLEQARTIINRHGMRLGQIAEQYHDRVPKGYICGQYPEPGESFRRSDPISLILSRGPQPSSVAPDADALPLAPSAPKLQEEEDDATSIQPPPTRAAEETETAEDTLVSRGAIVSVALPANGGPQEVKIVVRDAEGEHTDYMQTHDAGEVIEKSVQVIRPQGSTALVRIYVGGKLLRELRV